MDKITEKLNSGKLHTYEVPLSSDNEIKIVVIFRERMWTKVEDSKRFLHEVKITYDNQVIVKDIIGINRFIISLKAFIDRKNYFVNEDIYFTPKIKDNIKRLQCNFDRNVYIDWIEAGQILKTIHDVFTGYSKTHLFDKFSTEIVNFKTKKEASNFPKHMLENIKIIDH